MSRGYFGILVKIEIRIEERVWVACFVRAGAQVLAERLYVRGGDVGVLVEIERDIE